MKPTKKFENIINEENVPEINTSRGDTPVQTTASEPNESREVILNKIHHLLEQAYKATEPFHTNN